MSAQSKRFHIFHSLAGAALFLAMEGTLVAIFDIFSGKPAPGIIVVLVGAVLGGLGIVLVATEVIREVRDSLRMLTLLSTVLVEFIVFFAFQYLYLSLLAPGSFQALQLNPVDLLLHSTMIFAFNPLYLPTTLAAQSLLLINTLDSLVLVLFVLQNVWQFRNGAGNEPMK